MQTTLCTHLIVILKKEHYAEFGVFRGSLNLIPKSFECNNIFKNDTHKNAIFNDIFNGINFMYRDLF